MITTLQIVMFLAVLGLYFIGLSVLFTRSIKSNGIFHRKWVCLFVAMLVVFPVGSLILWLYLVFFCKRNPSV
jgi:amino acid transporter